MFGRGAPAAGTWLWANAAMRMAMKRFTKCGGDQRASARTGMIASSFAAWLLWV